MSQLPGGAAGSRAAQTLPDTAAAHGLDAETAQTQAKVIAHERRGFDQLVDGDRARAIESLGCAEAAYPGFHRVRELKNYLSGSGDRWRS